ncbi:MAG: NAD-dependent epimerase/dehydratase family protein [Candidatus Micrarchaeota archaeon]
MGGISGMKCVITGASGYVGSCIARYLAGKGFDIIEAGRSGSIRFSLGDKVDKRAFEAMDALVHCAYDFRPKAWEDIRRVNVLGSIEVLRAAKEAGVKKIIVLSSMSAFPGCASDYGRAKLEIEAEAKKMGAYIIRPGLVYGKSPRSVVGKMRSFLERYPIIPLMDTGKGKLYLCHNEDLAELIRSICTSKAIPPVVPITAAHEQGFTFKEMIEVMASSSGKKARFLPMPNLLLSFGLRAAELAGLNQGIRSDSFSSLLNLDPHPDFGQTRKSGVIFREFSVETMDQ